jgi:hypothetical protein
VAAYAQQGNPQPGDNVPMVKDMMKNATGRDMSYFAAATDKGLLVIFSCNTCPFVVKNESVTLKTIEYAKAHGLGVVVINSNEAKRDGDDSYDAMKKYAKKQGFEVPYLVDENSKLANAFGANHTPEVFLVDTKNKLMYKGAMNDNPGNPSEAKVIYINNAIDAMVSGKEITPNVTKSIGCSIKRKAS